MSKSDHHSDVEDVLASIRRLVAEETETAAETLVQAPRKVTALRLTKALRVHAPEAGEAGSATAPVTADPNDRHEALDDAPHEAAPTMPPENAEVTKAQSDADLAAQNARLAAHLVEQMNSQASVRVDHEPEGGQYLDDLETDDAPPRRAARAVPKSLGEKIKALEAAVARRSESWEPDGSRPRAGSSSHASGPSNAKGDQDTRDATALADLGDTELAEWSVSDESALREVIAEVVRQELQSTLGERITRNVRKLVRREIQRALSAHDLR